MSDLSPSAAHAHGYSGILKFLLHSVFSSPSLFHLMLLLLLPPPTPVEIVKTTRVPAAAAATVEVGATASWAPLAWSFQQFRRQHRHRRQSCFCSCSICSFSFRSLLHVSTCVCVCVDERAMFVSLLRHLLCRLSNTYLHLKKNRRFQSNHTTLSEFTKSTKKK